MSEEEAMREIVMYTRTTGCPFVTLAKRVMRDYALEYREVFIDKDDEARARVLNWTGFLAVPTIVAAEPGGILPYEEPEPLPRGMSPRGINRGAMITEPSMDDLITWLQQQGIIEAASAAD
jgi:glutaredoxin